jgi:hypothetical protein
VTQEGFMAASLYPVEQTDFEFIRDFAAGKIE